jgi:hypothetical protein
MTTMGMMSSGSWASYRAAAPLECSGDPDGDDEAGPIIGPPTWYAVWWFGPVIFQDVDTGELSEYVAPTGRYFALDRHADPYGAARRWATAMAKRHRDVYLVEGWDDGESFEHRVGGPPPRPRPSSPCSDPCDAGGNDDDRTRRPAPARAPAGHLGDLV